MALSEIALRLGGTSDRPIALEDGGETLVITEQDRDSAEAWKRSRTLVNTVLNLSVAAWAVGPPQPATPGAALQAERARLVAAADAAVARATAISACHRVRPATAGLPGRQSGPLGMVGCSGAERGPPRS